jgi:D-glycero-D-manno-heptose 1,7-bisphosphate phosphatase
MVEQAVVDLSLKNRRFFVVGDKKTDLELADRIGADGILVLTGYGKKEKEQRAADKQMQPDYIAADLPQAVQWILSQLAVGK